MMEERLESVVARIRTGETGGRRAAPDRPPLARPLGALLGADDPLATAPESCAAVRRLMRLQVWPHRLASGFPDDGWGVAGKTGTLPGIRNEIGVVEPPDGSRVAVAVLT